MNPNEETLIAIYRELEAYSRAGRSSMTISLDVLRALILAALAAERSLPDLEKRIVALETKTKC